jgi:hypothetical protein
MAEGMGTECGAHTPCEVHMMTIASQIA